MIDLEIHIDTEVQQTQCDTYIMQAGNGDFRVRDPRSHSTLLRITSYIYVVRCTYQENRHSALNLVRVYVARPVVLVPLR